MRFRIRVVLALALLTLPCTLASGQEVSRNVHFEVLHSFGGNGDGTEPGGAPVLDPRGNVYGFTSGGGEFSAGTVFELTPPAVPGGAWTESILHSFGGTMNGSPDGSYPTGLTRGTDGVLFGVTRTGGSADGGIAFALTRPADKGGVWQEKVIHTFGINTDGSEPLAGLTPGPDGVLFGTTIDGGAQSYGGVFELTPPSAAGGAWSEQLIYDFTQRVNPEVALTLTASGLLFGTGLGQDEPYVASSAFALAPPQAVGETWTESTLYNFGVDQPESPLTTGGTFLFGATFYGGAEAGGMVYALSPPALPHTPWTESSLYSFPQSNEGPQGQLVFGKSGVLYGTTAGSGVSENGSVYALTPPLQPGAGWAFHLIHNLNGATDGTSPQGGLSMDETGTLFGFASSGGMNSFGTVFAITGK